MIELDLKKTTTELVRWYILVALDFGRPHPVTEDILWRTLNDASLVVTANDVRRELSYLRDCKMVELTGIGDDHWEARLTPLGIDVREYTVDCRPGIGRPPKR